MAITSNFGLTPQGQASQSFFDAMKGITGSPAQAKYAETALAYPAQAQAVAQGAAQEQGMPGLISEYGDQAKILDLFAHDQTLAQKYMVPQQTVASMTLPGQGAVPTSSVPGMTQASNAAPYAGLTDPTAITKAMGMDVSSHSNILDLVSKAVDFGSEQIKKSTSANADAYKSVMDVMSMLITAEEKEKDRQLEREKLGGKSNILSQIALDAVSGSTLDSIMKKYSTSEDVTPDDILRIYNTNSIYGPAEENIQDLESRYGVKSTLTAEQKNRMFALQPATAAINSVKKTDFAGIGAGSPKADTVLGAINTPLGLGKKFLGKDTQDLVGLHQTFELLRQNVVRALQGARMSDVDIELASNYIPSIQDSPETIKTKLKNLDSFINSLSGRTSTSEGQTTGGDWEVVQ